MSTSLVGGIAAGNAIGGAIAQGGGTGGAFALGCLAQLLAAAIALAGRHQLATAVCRRESHPLASAANA
jgi:hypothetical protein